MSLHRRNPKRDQVEPEIIDALRRMGWSVVPLSITGGPDLLLGRQGRTVLAEVKTGRGKLRVTQETWVSEWRGGPVTILRSVENVIALTRLHEAPW